MSGQPEVITFDEFLKVKLRVARILEACEHPDADKLLILKVDMGTEERQIVAGIKKHYRPEDLVGKNIIVVANLAPRKMRGYESQGMLLAACTPGDSDIVVLTTDRDIPPGSGVA
ncbi:MAG: methionine--tRNA ligase subunit beta [Phycisphaerae bacterium]|nr:methionine--tRNA ligase subunit beta [Phycisphaerae bacterium]